MKELFSLSQNIELWKVYMKKICGAILLVDTFWVTKAHLPDKYQKIWLTVTSVTLLKGVSTLDVDYDASTPYPKKEKSLNATAFRLTLVGEDGFEPSKHDATDLQSAPFGHSGILPYEWKQNNGAGGRTRTPDLLITNQLLYQLSYTSILWRQPIYYSRLLIHCQ